MTMCKKSPMSNMLNHMELTRDSALWLAAEERLEKMADRQRRKKNKERWELK